MNQSISQMTFLSRRRSFQIIPFQEKTPQDIRLGNVDGNRDIQRERESERERSGNRKWLHPSFHNDVELTLSAPWEVRQLTICWFLLDCVSSLAHGVRALSFEKSLQMFQQRPRWYSGMCLESQMILLQLTSVTCFDLKSFWWVSRMNTARGLRDRFRGFAFLKMHPAVSPATSVFTEKMLINKWTP